MKIIKKKDFIEEKSLIYYTKLKLIDPIYFLLKLKLMASDEFRYLRA